MEGEVKVNKLMERDINIKILSILFAVLLWVYVINISNPIDVKIVSVPLKVINENTLQQKELFIDKVSENIYKLTNDVIDLYFYSNGSISVCDVKISKGFTTITNSKKILIDHNFSGDGELISIIAPTLSELKKYQ